MKSIPLKAFFSKLDIMNSIGEVVMVGQPMFKLRKDIESLAVQLNKDILEGMEAVLRQHAKAHHSKEVDRFLDEVFKR